MSATFPYLKGHGTENDFVLLPDPDGTVHGDLDPALVARLCDRRAGLGADGVLRVVRTAAYDDPDAVAARDRAEWFMDYRNADGSTSEMCGNGIRVFARYLVDHEGADPARRCPIGTRAGVLTVTFDADGLVTVDMGAPRVLGETKVAVGDRSAGRPRTCRWATRTPSPSWTPSTTPARCSRPPGHDAAVYPDGVNVEFVVRRGPQHVAMRVHERGSGETRSCGTGACAVMVAGALADGAARNTPYRVDVPGGTLQVTWTDDGPGPADRPRRPRRRGKLAGRDVNRLVSGDHLVRP